MKVLFDQVGSAVSRFYRVALVILAIAVIVGTVLFIRYAGEAFWDQGGGLYVTLALLAFFGWIIGQFVSLARRQKPVTFAGRKLTKTPRGPGPTFAFTMRAGRVRAADRRATPGNTLTISKSLGAGASNATEGTGPTEAEIEQADRLQREGRDWEKICSMVNPKHGEWPPTERQVYRILLQAFVAARRAQRGES